ncbi:histidine phosphatase family protein [Streptomyces alkaliterrae]|uniref:Histidine phosphatase family protein n=1 Tax=Streptomyces alkaliterrae TaxID=2213162 RepID=A0A5P0YYZ0_9ACTN|nr:histidine phosphatase family protein [Streptomyces alkaliterrae]MBB1256292.1 histidine phosphatase family protein [Streptomyces alkaliterrae]MBB1261859.1 histidine phosphatase family protein [Streptomyces alkaliterrae]MQS04767.1 histidine phosphatase family protein [Streptomyces alkaliterrae]
MRCRLTLLAAARCSPVLDTRFDDDRPLDNAGWQAVRRGAPALVGLAAAALRYRSPSERCRETGYALGLFPLAQPALRDCDMGRWRGRTLSEVAAREPDAVDAWLRDPYVAPHGGESLTAFIGRIGHWLDTRPAADDEWIVAVTEPAVLRAALCHALKTPPHAYWRIDAHPLAAVTLTGTAGDWHLSCA